MSEPIRFQVRHATSGEARSCEYVECAATSPARARARPLARFIVLRFPLAGPRTFCLASGWDVPGMVWRLPDDDRRRARALAAAEGLRLPEPAELPALARARARSEPPPAPSRSDPRQTELFEPTPPDFVAAACEAFDGDGEGRRVG